MNELPLKNMVVEVPVSIERTAQWRPLANVAYLCWVASPKNDHRALSRSIILCPPLGHEATHSYRAYRQLAEHLVALGLTVVRLEYPGTGNSTGDSARGELGENFLETCIAAVGEIKQQLDLQGFKEIGLFGARFGGSIASLCLVKTHFDFVILWAPVVKGKRYVRELKAISMTSSAVVLDETNNTLLESAGFEYSRQTIEAIQRFELNFDNLEKVEKLLFIENAISASVKLNKAAVVAYEEIEYVLAEPHNTQIPAHTFMAITKWLSSYPCDLIDKKETHKPEMGKTEITFEYQPEGKKPNKIKESIVSNPYSLFAIQTSVAKSDEYSPQKVIVFINAGSVYSAGPNRLYVNLARELVSEKLVTIRLDLSHLGDSVINDVKDENHPYAKTATQDIYNIFVWLRKRYPQATLCAAGVCSGGYNALQTAFKQVACPIDELIVINPLTFEWNESLSLDIPNINVDSETMHYKAKIVSLNAWKKFITGKVSYQYLIRFAMAYVVENSKMLVNKILERLGLVSRSTLGQNIKKLVLNKTRLHFIFSASDPGYLLLLREGGHCVSKLIKRKKVNVNIVDNADHTFSTHKSKKSLIQILREINSGK